jgi:hypothetical protein
MSENKQSNTGEQEIDLSVIFNKINGFFQKINTAIFRGIQFVIKYIITILVLSIIGSGIGFYLDETIKVYDNQIIVSPNFESTDYLYSKIDLIESKIKEKDTFFLKSIGVQEPDKLIKIQIKPIVDVYKFISNGSEKNFELLKLMAENGDINKIVEEKTTSKNYTYHLISFSTKKLTSNKNTIEPILKFLNNNNFYGKVQNEYINNIKVKMKQNEIIISQIDGFLNSFSNTTNGNTKSDKLVYYNENTQLNDVIETKNKLITEQGNLRVDLVSLDKIIKDNSSTINIENNKSVNGKLKIVLPIIFIFIFIFIHFFISFYKRQSEKEFNK